MKNVAIIGAGCAGLAAAWKLHREGCVHSLAVFEKSRGLSGRAATRTIEGCRVDYGANFIKLDGAPEVEDLILRQLPTEDLIQIDLPVLPFDSAGEIGDGDPSQNREPKWNYRSGISTLGKLLAATLPNPVRREVLIERMSRRDQSWFLHSGNEEFGPFDDVLLTPPPAQSAEILSPHFPNLAEKLASAEYYRQFCFAFRCKGKIDRPREFHALINSDRRHPIAWLSFENDKSGHVVGDDSLIVVQMSPDWSSAHFEDDREDLAAEAFAHAKTLLQSPTAEFSWWNAQRWRFAHPAGAFSREGTEDSAQEGIHLAGDAFAGKGRVQLALQSGLDVAAQLIASPACAPSTILDPREK